MENFWQCIDFFFSPLYTKTGSFWKERALWNADLLFVLLVAYCLVQPPLTGTLVIRRGAMVRNVYLSWSTAVVSTFFHPVRVLLYISTRVRPAHRWRVSKNKAKTRFQLYLSKDCLLSLLQRSVLNCPNRSYTLSFWWSNIGNSIHSYYFFFYFCRV